MPLSISCAIVARCSRNCSCCLNCASRCSSSFLDSRTRRCARSTNIAAVSGAFILLPYCSWCIGDSDACPKPRRFAFTMRLATYSTRPSTRASSTVSRDSGAFLHRMHVEPSMLFTAVRFRRLGCQLAAAAISRIWHPFPCHKTSDGTRISSQIGRSFLFDLSRLSPKCVPSPSRKSCSASIRHASVLRFVSLAFPSFHNSLSERIA